MFAVPFYPLYYQQLGVSDPRHAVLLVGIGDSAFGTLFFLFGPVWGILGDRYGRKPMLLRATFGVIVFYGAMGFATRYYHVMVLRILAGAVSGSISASMALMASITPREKLPWSIGMGQSTYFLALVIGPALGGVIAGFAGYRLPFFLISAFAAVAFLIIWLFVHEDYVRPPAVTGREGAATYLRNLASTFKSRPVAVALLGILIVQTGPTVISPAFPVLMQSLSPSMSVATLAGIAMSAMGVASALASVLMARYSKRFGLSRMLVIGCILSGITLAPVGLVGRVFASMALIAVFGVFNGTMRTAATSIIGLVVPASAIGATYGVMQSVNAVPVIIGPLGTGLTTLGLGVQGAFLAYGTFLVAGGLLLWKLLPEVEQSAPVPQETGQPAARAP